MLALHIAKFVKQYVNNTVSCGGIKLHVPGCVSIVTFFLWDTPELAPLPAFGAEKELGTPRTVPTSLSAIHLGCQGAISVLPDNEHNQALLSSGLECSYRGSSERSVAGQGPTHVRF